MNKKFNGRYLYSIALFLSLLIITLPFYTSSAMAAMGGNFNGEVVKRKAEPINLLAELDDVTGMAATGTNTTSVTNAAEACIEKNKKTHALVDALDNDIIKILEKISSFMVAISSIWTAVKSIMLSVALVFYNNPYTTYAGWLKQKVVHGIDSALGIINVIVGCAWAKWCKFDLPISSETKIPISLGPNDNIYLAIGCLCPTAVLINMRKLKTIYQTYNCCVEQACTNGMSTMSCERQLSEAECMYWGKGVIASAILKIIMGVMSWLLFKHVIKPLIELEIPYIGVIAGLAMIYFSVMNITNAIKMMGKVFSEPDCGDLGFDKLKDEMWEEWRYANVGTTEVLVVDTDGDGIGDKRMTAKEYTAWKQARGKS